MVTTKATQTRPSLDILDELVPGASLRPVNLHATQGILQLKMPVWDRDKGVTGAPSTVRSPRRSKRSQSGSGRKQKSQMPGSMTTHDRPLDDDVSPTTSAPGSPLVESPHFIVPEKNTSPPEKAVGQGLLTIRKEVSMPTAEVLLSQPADLARCQTRQDHNDVGRQP